MSEISKAFWSVIVGLFFFYIGIKPYVYFLQCIAIGVGTGCLIGSIMLISLHFFIKELESNKTTTLKTKTTLKYLTNIKNFFSRINL